MFGNFLRFFVHGNLIVLTDIVCHLQDLHRHGARTHGDLQLVTDLHFVAGLDHAAVDADAAVVAGFVGHGAALDETGNFQIFIQTHITYLPNLSMFYWV